MKIYHTSPEKINKITKTGVFGECLCFSDDIYFMTQAETPVVYTLEIDEEKIIDAFDLDGKSVIKDIADYFDTNDEHAERILDGRKVVGALDGYDGEDDWWVQGKQGEAAKNMGYEAARGEDEQGTVYIVPMFGREKDLIEEK